MKLRSLIHKALTVTTADDAVHRLVLSPVGDGWHETVGVPVEVCEVLRSIPQSPGEYVIADEETPAPEGEDEGDDEHEEEETDGETDAEEEDGQEEGARHPSSRKRRKRKH